MFKKISSSLHGRHGVQEDCKSFPATMGNISAFVEQSLQELGEMDGAKLLGQRKPRRAPSHIHLYISTEIWPLCIHTYTYKYKCTGLCEGCVQTFRFHSPEAPLAQKGTCSEHAALPRSGRGGVFKNCYVWLPFAWDPGYQHFTAR